MIGGIVVYRLYSERNKNEKGELDVYKYEGFSEAFRNQCFYILEDVFDPYHMDKNIWGQVHDNFAREKGLKSLYSIHSDSKSNCEVYIAKANDKDFLDFIDFSFCVIDKYCRNINGYVYNYLAKVNDAIVELNDRFRQHNYGYEFINGEVIRIDTRVLHENVIKPTLKLLYEEEFEGADEEFLKAFEYRRKGDNKNAILEALKAFESTMKTICDKKGYAYDKTKDTAQKLISILEKSGFYPSYLNSHLTNIRTTLETGLPVLRNKNSGHGQGITVVNISDEFTEYALNLAATNILLLTKIYRENK